MDCDDEEDENGRARYLCAPLDVAIFTVCMASTAWTGDANDKQSDRGLTIAIDAKECKCRLENVGVRRERCVHPSQACN